jgi:hypothetical protein
MKKFVYIISLVTIGLILSSWGSKGHRKISGNLVACLPAELTFLQPAWTNFVRDHASDADYRKSQDPDESPRHYIDIDNYQVFVETGRIPQTFDSVVGQFGYSFVIDQGTLPWTTLITFDSLTSCFQRGDWNRSALFAADLGHYVGDGHMPLHITRNYNGQFTGQTGIHSRYESTMISRYESQLVYPADPAQYVDNAGEYVFRYIYENYRYVDSILIADNYAKTIAGSTSSDAYYQALWEQSGDFTRRMMQNASAALADLIYTAWVRAGSPMMYPNAAPELEITGHQDAIRIFPNPVYQALTLEADIPGGHETATIRVYDSKGTVIDEFPDQLLSGGALKIKRDVAKYPAGIYLCRIAAGSFTATRRFVVVP